MSLTGYVVDDHRFTLLVHGQSELVVIADWRHVCWKTEPVYLEPWGSVVYFTAPAEHHQACAVGGYMDSEGVPQPPTCHPDCEQVSLKF